MQLSDIVPVSKIEDRLGQSLAVERIDSTDWRALADRDANSCFGVAGRAWHLAVTDSEANLDPYMLGSYFDSEDPALAEAIEDVIGEPVMHEFGFLEATIQHAGKPFVVATSLLAHLTAGELFWYDIGMSNPSTPLKPAERASPSHGFRGFGLLGDVVNRINAAARERSCGTIGLIVAHKPIVQVLQRLGFRVEDSEMGRLGMRIGMSIPMAKVVE